MRRKFAKPAGLVARIWRSGKRVDGRWLTLDMTARYLADRPVVMPGVGRYAFTPMKIRSFSAMIAVATLMFMWIAIAARGAEMAVPMLSSADIGGLHRKITTKSSDAQRYFDQGLALMYSFDHDNAIRSF